MARIGELAADSAESIGGFAEGFYDAATVVPNGVAAVASEKKVGHIVQGSAKRQAPGCVNAVGNARPKW